MKNRMQIVLLIFCIVIVGITAKLGYEQMFHASQLENGALNARLREIDIKPNRGAVYDHNGNAIAISIATESVYINPKTVRSADERVNNRQDKEEVIRTLASVLELDEEAVAEKVEQNVSFAYIKRHITDEQAEVLHKLGYKGVYFLEESRRSYPKGTLASQIVGFAGIDNQGLNGIELQYDNTLLGNPGKFLMEYDGAGNEIPQATESYIPSEPGCDVYLTLDETIQYIVERELKNVVQEQDAVGATAIVMNVKTGSVLGMANYPDYNPNDYGSVDSSLWSNFAVNGLYEPGSTFKILTTAMALEERVTTLNEEGFYCAGYQYIGKMKMRCHKAAGHGAESFTQGVANSCNPVFVEVSRRLGMEKFYDYLEGFGMTQPTGIDLPGEADSLIVPEKSAVPYDLAAMAIGQSNAFTPMQMITAISAVANGGQLMKPYIVEKIVDPDGNIVQERQPEVVRQVISEQTAREVWAALETVVSSGTGKQGQIEGYTVAGKTGTAEKVANGTYSSARMVSFAGFAPADNPQIACLVIVDEPNDAHGGSTAGPVFQNIMEDTLRYLEVPKNVTVNKTTTVEEVLVPSLENMHPVEAIEAVKAAGLTPIVETQGDALLTYVPAAGTNVQKTGNVYLYCGSSESTQIVMPSLYGRTIKEVDRILAGIGLSGTMNGSGLCTGQSISPGQLVERGTAVIVDFQTTAQVEAAQAVAEGEGLTKEGAAVDGEV